MAHRIWAEWEVTNTIVFQNNKKVPFIFGGDFFIILFFEKTFLINFLITNLLTSGHLNHQSMDIFKINLKDISILNSRFGIITNRCSGVSFYCDKVILVRKVNREYNKYHKQSTGLSFGR
jgi:hypothetical protein